MSSIRIGAAVLALCCCTALVMGQDQRMSMQQLQVLKEKQLYREFDRAYARSDFGYAYQVLKIALQKRDAARRRPKPHKKYTPLFNTLSRRLADGEALKGIEACQNQLLSLCEAQIEAAKAFATTPTVATLEATFDGLLTDIRARFKAAQAQSKNGNHQEALKQLRDLERFESHLHGWSTEVDRVERLYVAQLVAQAKKLIGDRLWDPAEVALNRALSIHEGGKALEVLDTLERGRTADELGAEARRFLEQQQYEQAMKSIDEALEIYPEGRYLTTVRNDVAAAWINNLAADIPRLMERGGENFDTAREAALSLFQIARLDPSHPILKNRKDRARRNFGAAALQRARSHGDSRERFATSYALYLIAQRNLGEGIVRMERVKDAAGRFNRKRASQLVLAVEDLTGQAATFREAVSARSFHVVENLALPDLRTRTREQYNSRPDEDLEFQDLRPDGRSATALLRIDVSQYMSERWPSEPKGIPSEYVSGEEEFINPDWEEKRKELEELRRKLDDPKDKDKKAKRITERTYSLIKLEFERIPRSQKRPVYSKYEYFEIAHKQRTEVELRLTLSDMITREKIATDSITFSNNSRGMEISGVSETDASGLRNQPVRLPEPEQMLQRAEREVLDQLEEKIVQILPRYTHRFFNEGAKLFRAGRRADAAEHFLCHWAFFRGRLEPAQKELIQRVLRDEVGFDLVRDGRLFETMVRRVAPVVR